LLTRSNASYSAFRQSIEADAVLFRVGLRGKSCGALRLIGKSGMCLDKGNAELEWRAIDGHLHGVEQMIYASERPR
jgi:hypothetical protein